MVFHFTKYEILKPECTKDGFLNAGLGIQTGTQCYVHLYSTQEQNTVYKRVLQMLLETFMNAYHVCIHKLLCLHIMRRKKNIRFLSLHNILGMFSFVASDVCFIKTDTLYIGYHLCIAGLELARVPRVPGTRRNSEHHLRHPLFLRFLLLTGTCRAHSM